MTGKPLRSTARHSYSRPGLQYINDGLSKTWFFRFSSLAFIVMGTPVLDVFVRGLLGFLLLTMVAIFSGLLESSFNRVVRSIRRGVSHNRLLVLFSVWYLVGIVLNALIRGNGLDDWRLMMWPVVLLLGTCFAFAFMHDENCYRLFQIGFLVVSGIQAAISIPTLAHTVGIARDMWLETGGTWIYGNPSSFALLAILLPMFMWRAIKESGLLRVLLLASCLLILVAIFISSFATPVALIMLGSLLVLALAILIPTRGQNRLVSLLVAGILLSASLVAYRLTFDNPLTAPARSRIENFLNDPVSGGYEGEIIRTASRVYLAEISISSFQAEPLFGKGGGNTRYSKFVGGHSSLADTMGSYGLLGGGGALLGVILVMLVTAALRLWQERNWETLCALATVLLLVVAGIADPFWEGAQLAYVLVMARTVLAGTTRPAPRHLAIGQARRRRSLAR